MIFNSLYYPNILGGAEKSVQTIAEGLMDHGITPVIVTTSHENKIGHVNGVKVYYVRTKNLYWMYNSKEKNIIQKALWHTIDMYNPFYSSINKILEEEKPDVVHTNNLAGFSVSIWKMAKKRNIKVVHTLRDHYLLCIRSTMFNHNENCKKQCPVCKLYSIPKRWMSEYVDTVVGISNFILNRHLEFGFFKESEKKVIYNPIDIQPKDVRNRDVDTINLGYAGILTYEKGIEYLLERFTKLNMKNIHLYIFGRGARKDYGTMLREKYARPNIHFMGFKEQNEIYREIDIMVVPSLLNEAFGRTVIEANFNGIPALVSNRGALLELVIEGQNGFIYDPEKNGDFEQKLIKTIEMVKQKTFHFNPEPFLKEHIIEQYLTVYGFR